jgi:hypothetical protein
VARGEPGAPDGKTLASGGADATVQVRDLPLRIVSRQMAPDDSFSGSSTKPTPVRETNWQLAECLDGETEAERYPAIGQEVTHA